MANINVSIQQSPCHHVLRAQQHPWAV